jgi:hypothetical protein
MGVTESLALSVVLATRNRCDSLARLLNDLEAQVGAPPFEVVVADNGSSDETPAVLASATRALPVRTVTVAAPGKGRALNAALRLARGELIVFTDDDVRPDPAWLAELAESAARHPEFAVFGGRIDVDARTVPAWIRRSQNLMGLLTSEHAPGSPIYDRGRYPFGPNMAVRRRLIERLEAPYPEDMGPGTALPVGDESGFLLRLSAPDARDRLFVRTARVTHQVEAVNVGFGEALRRSFLQGSAQGRLGIPAVPSDGPGRSGSFVRQMARRIRTCRSLRELACVCIRHCGYLLRARRTKAPQPLDGGSPWLNATR